MRHEPRQQTTITKLDDNVAFPTINPPGELYASTFKEKVQTRYGTLKINSIPGSYSKL